MKNAIKILIFSILSLFLLKTTVSADSYYKFSEKENEVIWKVLNYVVDKVETGETSTKRLNKMKEMQTFSHVHDGKIGLYNVLDSIIDRLEDLDAQDDGFEISIVQDGKEIEIIDNVVKIKRKPFDLVIKSNVEGFVGVHASYSSGTYDLALNGEKIYMESEEDGILPFCGGCGMAAYEYNPNKSITLVEEGDVGVNYLFKERYNNVSIVGNVMEGVRKIENLGIIKDEDIKVENSDKDLYLTFMSDFSFFNRNTYDERFYEIQREALKIEFE